MTKAPKSKNTAVFINLQASWQHTYIGVNGFLGRICNTHILPLGAQNPYHGSQWWCRYSLFQCSTCILQPLSNEERERHKGAVLSVCSAKGCA